MKFGKIETHIAKAGLQSARLFASLDFVWLKHFQRECGPLEGGAGIHACGYSAISCRALAPEGFSGLTVTLVLL